MNNNNRNNNNRRRGRGNRPQGGANQMNRIDNRARGNAAQMLDKYKKLAHDAALNDDRVQSEYYLQFADHYFRVIADNKARQEEQRGKRDEQRGDSADDRGDGDSDRGPRRSRGRNRNDDSEQNSSAPAERNGESKGEDENPFTRDNRKNADDVKPKAEKPRTRRPRREENAAQSDGELDMSALPPAIGVGSEADEAAPKKVRKPRAKKPSPDEGDSLQTVS